MISPKASLKKATLVSLLLVGGFLGACSQATTEETSAPAGTVAESDAATSADDTTAAAPTTESTDTNAGDPTNRFINTDGGVAIEGTDPVAYFTEGAPVEGSEEFTHDWNGATWHFASAENRDLFAADPIKYAPQYGGHCAWAASQGYVAEIDPTAWSIVDDRLYLNYDANIQQRWEKDIPGFIAAADEQWPSVVEENM